MRLSHRAWVYEGCHDRELRILDEDDLQLLWLPLAHAFGKVLISAQLACGFATAIDGRVDKIVENMARGQADVHGRRPAHLREGPRQGRHLRRRGPKKKLFEPRSPWGESRPPAARGQVGTRCR